MSRTLVEDLAATLSAGLGSGFSAVDAGTYVALVHPDFGLAAVVPTDREDEAERAAADLTSRALAAGVAWQAMRFSISSSGVKPPWVVRAGESMKVDIVAAMARGSASRPPLGVDAALKVVVTVASEPAKSKPEPGIPPQFLRLAQACVEKALNGDKAWVVGVEIDSKDVVSPSFLLPAILIHAAQTWAVPVVAKKGEGGFLVRLAPDPKAILGYRVTGVDMSSPVLLFLLVVNLVRRSFSGGECLLDESLRRFSDFLAANGIDTDTVGDVDVKVASVS